MTNPEDPQRWGQPQQPNPDPYPLTGGHAPQEPVTGGIVSYNASAFDEDGSSQVPPADSGSFAAPTSGAQAAQFGAPSTGAHDAQFGAAPTTSGFDSQYGTGQYGTGQYGAGQYGAASQPTSGGFPAQPGYGPPSAASPYDAGTPKRSRSRTPLLLGVGGLVLVGLLVAGYFVFFTFGGIQNGEGEIKNAKAFLTQTHSKWKEELPSDGIEVSSKSACYYVLNDSDKITNQVACGPSRRASTPKGAVWDMYRFSVNGSGDSQTASDAQATDISKAAPKSGSLVTVDGDAPADDGLGLKEPPLPKAPSKVVYEKAGYEVSEKSLGAIAQFTGSPMLIAPGAQLTLISKQEATSATIDGKLMAPAEGEKFYVITVTGESGPITETADNELKFTFDGASIEAPGVPQNLGETSYLVSWPDGAKGSMDLVSSKHTQSLSLDDGARAEDKTAEMYYSGKTAIETPLSAVVALPETASAAGAVFKLDITFSTGKLTPFLTDQGWAPAGQLWMVLEFADAGTVVTPGTSYTKYQYTCTTSSVDGGSVFECGPDGSSSGKLIAAVPADQRTFTVNMVAKLSVTGDGVPETTVDFAPGATQIAFP